MRGGRAFEDISSLLMQSKIERRGALFCFLLSMCRAEIPSCILDKPSPVIPPDSS